MSTNPVPPSKRAEEIIEKLPSSPSLITKTGTALLGTGLIAAAISQELYVVNEESIVLIASLIVFTYIGKVLWTISFLNDMRISLTHLHSMVDITRTLFSVGWGSYQPHQKRSQQCSCWTYWCCETAYRLCGSDERCRLHYSRPLRPVKSKLYISRNCSFRCYVSFHFYTHIPTQSQQETARLESENFVKQQNIAVAAELKSVLDSWVRYEQQEKEREQADLTKSVIDKVVASLRDEKVQRDILVNAVAEIEGE